MNFPTLPMMSSPRPDSARMASVLGGLLSGVSRGGSMPMDQVQALLTVKIQQTGGMLADALKGMKTGKDENDFTSGVKIEVRQLKED